MTRKKVRQDFSLESGVPENVATRDVLPSAHSCGGKPASCQQRKYLIQRGGLSRQLQHQERPSLLDSELRRANLRDRRSTARLRERMRSSTRLDQADE